MVVWVLTISTSVTYSRMIIRGGLHFPFSQFQDFIEVLADIGMPIGCLTGGGRRISRGPKSQ